MIILKHADKIFTIYANLGRFLVEKHTVVKRGQAIANAKSNKDAFFHFEIRLENKALDPMKHLGSANN